MPRPDPGHVGTDEILAQIEKRIQAVYRQAEKEVEAKWLKYMESFAEEDAAQAERLSNGEITRQEYQNWRMRHIATGKRWEAMRDTIAEDYHNANLNAAKLSRSGMADVYALNLNYGTYMIEHSGRIDTGFTLYNHKAAEALLRKEWSISPESGKNAFLPKPSAKKKKWLRENPDKLWNAEKIQSAVTQGILTGESAQDMARRLAGVGEMDKHQAIRNARTMSTNVQNYGRMQSADRAKSLGVDLVDEWVAILDHATRHSHRQMHGQRKEHDPDVPFRNGCRWPGDPAGPAAEVYNCRCDLISWVKGFEGDTVKENPAMGDMSFEQWQGKQNEPTSRIPRQIYDSVSPQSASDDWFEYENANYMREYVKTGRMPTENMYGDEMELEQRQRLAAEAELMQTTAENTKTKYKTVYRGIVMDEDEVRAMFTPGETYVFDTLSSTATDKKVAEIYMNPENVGGGVPVILEIQKSDGVYGFDRDGMEIVMPKGAQFRITRNFMDRDGTVHISLYSKKGDNIRR